MFPTQPSSSSPKCPVSHGFGPSSVHLPGKGAGGNATLKDVANPLCDFFITSLISLWSEGIRKDGKRTADTNRLPLKPGLKAGVTSQLSMTFLGCSAICRACVRAKPRRCQGQRGFGWYLNFKATPGALPISHATRRAHPSLLTHHHPSQLLCVTQARFTCRTAGKAKKNQSFSQFISRHLGSVALLQGLDC